MTKSPMATSSSAVMTCGAVSFLPLMNVPLVLFRSTTMTLPSFSTKRVCRLDTFPRASTMSLSSTRPTVISFLSKSSRFSSPAFSAMRIDSIGLVPDVEADRVRRVLVPLLDLVDRLADAVGVGVDDLRRDEDGDLVLLLHELARLEE